MSGGQAARGAPRGQPPPTPTLRTASGPWTIHVRSIAIVCVVAGAVAAFFLALYPVKHYPLPIGWDSPRYLAQTNIVAARGLSGVPRALPPPSKTLASRAGFPVVVLSLSALFGASTFKLATTVPVAAAVATALAAGALVSVCRRRADWELAVVAAVVGVSPVLVRLMAPETYTDNLMAAALFLGGFAAAAVAVREGRGLWAAILLFGAGGLAHEPFFGMILGVIALVALAHGPGSWRSWRSGAKAWSTPSGRLLEVAGGAGAVAAVGIFALLRTPPDTPKLSLGELKKKLREDVPLYLFPVTAPLAAVGTAALAAAGRRTRSPESPNGTGGAVPPGEARFLLAVLVAWGLIVALAVAAFAAGRTVPAHRFLAMLIPLPVLGAVGILAAARLAGRARRVGRALAVLVVALGLGGSALLGFHDLYSTLPNTRGVEWLETHKLQQAATAARYLDAMRVPPSTPVVFVVDDTGKNPLSYVPEMAFIIRSALPADRIERSWFYVGNPDRYLARAATHRDHPATYNVNSDRFWDPLSRMLATTRVRPVALLLKDFDPLFFALLGRHPDWLVARGVVALEGPRPGHVLPSAPGPRGLRSAAQGGAVGVGTIAVLGLIGLGWAIGLLPRTVRPFEVLALSPAFGIGFLLFAGILVDAVGIRLTGAGGVLAVAVAALSGWGVVALVRRRGAEMAAPR